MLVRIKYLYLLVYISSHPSAVKISEQKFMLPQIFLSTHLALNISLFLGKTDLSSLIFRILLVGQQTSDLTYLAVKAIKYGVVAYLKCVGLLMFPQKYCPHPEDNVLKLPVLELALSSLMLNSTLLGILQDAGCTQDQDYVHLFLPGDSQSGKIPSPSTSTTNF
ncbi:hypothetical protein BTVI_104994 [Pitangus sulphuratus]|nr:hypothetical protein BTVI_104994 [Pitangus sulphuratus]